MGAKGFWRRLWQKSGRKRQAKEISSRVGAEEFGRVLAGIAQRGETKWASGFRAIIAEQDPDSFPAPLGAALVSASETLWATAQVYAAKLPEDRWYALEEAYYAEVWEGIKSRFGSDRAAYDEFVRRLGGILLPDELKAEWARRTGVHEVLLLAVEQISEAANQWLGADKEKAAKAVALGDVVGSVLFLAPDEVRTTVSSVAGILFIQYSANVYKEFHKAEFEVV